MKHVKDMTAEEVCVYHAYTVEIATHCMAVDPKSHPVEKLAMLCLFIKSEGRASMNLNLEYEIDPDLFITDALTMTIQFTDNALWLLANGKGGKVLGIEEATRIAEANKSVMRHGRFRPVLTEVFEEFFNQAKRRGYP